MKSGIIVPKLATLENIAMELGDIVSVRNLAVAPLYGDDSFKDGVVLLNEAVEKGGFSVTESKEVKSLTVKNKLGERVFIAEGQIIEGDSQNRRTVYSTLVPAHSGNISVPVMCVEHGKGLVSHSRYSGSNTFIMPALRGNEPDKTWTTLLQRPRYIRGADHRTDQQKTWDAVTTITHVLNRTQILSAEDVRNENYCDVLANAKLDDYLGNIERNALPNQIGYVAVVGRSDGGFDLYTDFFGNQSHLNGLYEKLLASVALVAQLHYQDSRYKHNRELALGGIDKDTFATFLGTISDARVDRVPKIGENPTLGQRLRLSASPDIWVDSDGKEVKRTIGDGDLYRLRGKVDGSALLIEENYVQTFAKCNLN